LEKNMSKYTSSLLSAMALLLGAAALPAHAQNNAVMTPDQIDARYDAAKKQCESMTGDQKDVCLKQADADKDVAKAQARPAKKRLKPTTTWRRLARKPITTWR
jgi:hypothetical protein